MKSVLFGIDVVIGFIALGGFFPAMIAHALLSNSFDPEKLKGSSSRGKAGAAQNLLAPIECFDESDQWLWRIRDRGLKAFAIAALLFIILSIVSTVLGIPIAPPK
jgi:hypothetical protein